MDKNKEKAEWHGIPRNEINWNPKINEEKCTGCGMCVLSCGKKVYDFDKQNNRSIVARPENCMVGCTSCEVWCIFDAISFPDKKYVKDLIKEKNILKQVKNKLEENLKSECCSNCTGSCCGGDKK